MLQDKQSYEVPFEHVKHEASHLVHLLSASFSQNPPLHSNTQILSSKNLFPLQLVHYLLVGPEQVLQDDSQAKHFLTSLLPKNPAGQVATQVVPNKKVPYLHEVQSSLE